MLYTAYFLDGPQIGQFHPIAHVLNPFMVNMTEATTIGFRAWDPKTDVPPLQVLEYHLWPPVYGRVCHYKIAPPPPEMPGLMKAMIDQMRELDDYHNTPNVIIDELLGGLGLD